MLSHFQAVAQRFPFYNLKVENGLVQSQSSCLTQDSFGNLWMGTLGGLSRFDGKKVVNFTVSDGLVSNTIQDIIFSKNKILYISTANGFQSFDGKNFTEYFGIDKQKIKQLSQLLEGNKKQIYLLNKGQLCVLNLKSEKLEKQKINNSLLSICYKNNTLKASSGNTLYNLDENKFCSKTDSVISEESDLVILKMFEDSRKNFWLLCNKGLYFLRENKIKPFLVNGRKAIEIPLLGAAEDRNGQIWFASYSGAFRKKDSSINHFGQENGLTNNIVYDILCDKEGNIWMSTDGEGIFRYSGGPFISFDERFGLPNKQVTGICGDDKGTLYFATYQGKISAYNIGQGVKEIITSQLKNDVVTSMSFQRNAGLWIGTRNSGLYVLQNNKIKKFRFEGEENEANEKITTLYKDENERLFAGMQKNMFEIRNEISKKIFLNNAQVIAATSIGVDSLLIATNNGFYIYHNEIAALWKSNTKLDSITIQCMSFSNGNLFAGTTEAGIIVYNFSRKKQSVLNTKNGLSSDFIYNIIKDKTGNIWAGTGKGICKITNEKTDQFSIHIYGKDNGIIGLESNSNAAFADNNGYLWFGTTEGVSCYSPTAKPTINNPATIILESVNLFGGKIIDSNFYSAKTGWYNVPQDLRLPYRFNNISFSFQAISLSPVDKILYRYILDGSGKNWSEWSEENTINFLALEPGNYTLNVMCKINGIIQKQTQLSYSFSIKTPFHKSIWFVISIFALAILLGVYLQYAANRRKVKRQLREEALRKEEQSRIRERTAEDFHDEVGNKLTRINVLTSVLKSKINTPNIDAERIIQQIQDNSQQLYAGTRDILWSLQPSNDNLFEILNHVRDLAVELFSETEINFNISGNEESYKDYKMPLDKSRNFIMIWKEALNNCIKYSAARNVLFQIQAANEKQIQIRLVDDGKGFDIATSKAGNGLKNMQARAKRLDANFEILSSENKGTQVILTLSETK